MERDVIILMTGMMTGCSFVAGLTGMGQAIVYQTIWSVLGSFNVHGAGDLKAGVAISFLMGGITAVALTTRALYLAGGDIRWDIVIGMFPGSVICSFLGVAALTSLDQDGLKKTLGCIFMSFSCWQLYTSFRNHWRKEAEAREAIEQWAKERKERKTRLNGNGDANERIGDALVDPTANVDLEVQASTTPAPEHNGIEMQSLAASSPPDGDVPRPMENGTGMADDSSSHSHPDAQPQSQSTSLVADSSSDAGQAEGAVILPVNGFVTANGMSPLVEDETADVDQPPSFPPGTTVKSPSSPSSSSSRVRRFMVWLSALMKTRLFLYALGVGALSGFLGGCFGTNGPPVILFFTFIGANKSEVRDTYNAFSLLTLPFRLISMLVFPVFKEQQWPVYLLSVPATLSGNLVGNWAHHRVNAQLVQIALQSFVLLASLSLVDALKRDAGIFERFILAVFCLIVTLCFVALWYGHHVHKRWAKQQPKLAKLLEQKQALDEARLARKKRKMAECRKLGVEYVEGAERMGSDESKSIDLSTSIASNSQQQQGEEESPAVPTY